jgi:hypothetical protein
MTNRVCVIVIKLDFMMTPVIVIVFRLVYWSYLESHEILGMTNSSGLQYRNSKTQTSIAVHFSFLVEEGLKPNLGWKGPLQPKLQHRE